MIRGHGGNTFALARALGCPVEAIVDMSSNVNPFGPPPGLLPHLNRHMERICALPEVDAGSAVERFAACYGIPPEQVVAGNGTTQLIYDLPRALAMRRALIVGPTYADYHDGCRRNRVDSAYWLTRAEDDFRPDLEAAAEALAACDTLYICNPNNPTGVLLEGDALRRLSRKWPHKTIVVDESYLPFVDDPARWSLMVERPENVLVLHSMSKIFRVPGLRIGFAVGAPDVVARLRRYSLPWSVNALAMAAVHYLLGSDRAIARFVRETRDRLRQERTAMEGRLSAIDGLRCFPSTTGFFLLRLPDPYRSGAVCRQLARERILIRDCANFEGLSDRFVRISLKDSSLNAKCAQVLEMTLAQPPGDEPRP